MVDHIYYGRLNLLQYVDIASADQIATADQIH